MASRVQLRILSRQVLTYVQAKQATEAKGYIFESSHDEIVARAKKEGRVRVLTTQRNLKPLAEAFKKKYPFIDLRIEEVQGTDTHQRMVLEMKSGTAKGWDTNYVAADLYDDYIPHQKKFDILGMAQHGVLAIPPEMIDPDKPQHYSLHQQYPGCSLQQETDRSGQGSQRMG